MPTVIDAFILELGLDSSKLKKGSKEAIDYLKQQGAEWKKIAESMEKSGKNSAESLGYLNTKLMQFGQLIIGGKVTGDIIKFAANITQQDAATGRLAYTLETTSSELNRWGNAAQLAGGSADATKAFIGGLTSEFQKLAITGESSLIPYFRGLGVQISDASGKMRPFADIIRDVSNAVAKRGPAEGAEWLRSIGADPGSIALIIKGGAELERFLALGEKLNSVNEKSTKNATDLAFAYNAITIAATNAGRAVLNWLGGKGLTDLLASHTGTLNELTKGEWISKTSLLGSIVYGTKFRGFATAPEASVSASNATTGSGAFKTQEEKEAFIRKEAMSRGINPDIAMAVSKSEGFNTYQSSVIRKDGSREPSFGAFQLYMGGGLGNVFQKQTGLDPRNKETEREQIQFALDQAKQSGWGAWHGWKGSQWAGINQGSGGGTSSSDIKIDNITINTQATDAQSIAATIKPAIERSSLAYQGQGGNQ